MILGEDFGAHSVLLEERNLFLCGAKPWEIILWPHFDLGFLTIGVILSNSAFQFSE